MMSRRHRRVGALLTCGAFLLSGLAACSDGGDDDGDSAREPGSSTTDVTEPAPAPLEIVNETAWPMHPIDGRFRGANALGPGDVDGDGDTDYITNYEFDQRWVVALHPGAGDTSESGEEVRRSWPTVEVWGPEPLVEGSGRNPESTALGDFDGDGNIDAAGAHGFSDLAAFEGSAPGVHLVWGPEASDATNPDAWEDGGWVPATVDVGHPHWASAHDVNGDGLLDVTFGGRQHGGGGGYDNPDSPNGNGTVTGIGWLEAPAAEDDRRDLSKWQAHHIDADVPSGHGFVFADLDGDGDDDIVDANADFDTPEDQEDVAWYENPGDGTEAQREAWPRTTLLASPDFYAKPSVAAGDIDGDGDLDIATQTDQDLLQFRNDGEADPGFEAVRLPKPPEARWRSRTVRLADFDLDGDLDLVGMLIHEDNELSPALASVFLLLNEGDPFTEQGWRFLPVKWGPGPTMRIPGFGEKWDQADVVDVDGDGDLDIVANCEEWWVEDRGEVAPFFAEGVAPSAVAVVWFENRLAEPAPTYEERDGLAVLEAERPTLIADSAWVERAPVHNDPTATPALQAHNGITPEAGTLAPEDSDGVSYDVAVSGGTYSVWVRLYAPAVFGPELGGDESDSVWVQVGDNVAQVAGDEPGGPDGEWRWVSLPATVDLDAGTVELVLRPRDRGVAVDRVLLSSDPSFMPDGDGPDPTVATAPT